MSSLDHQRWKQIEDLLQRALDLEPGERASFLAHACAGDDALRIEVQALLSKEAEARSFMESPAVLCVAEQITGQSAAPLSEISHYRIEAPIGSGGMGEVYKARDEILQRTVALKMLPAEFTSDSDRVQRFEQEAFAASRLNHPNIITIFEITHVNGAHFIAEEFVEGQTLRELLTDPVTRKPRKLPVDKAVDIAIQVAGALKAAHTAWIIHRDIKPENIMVREDGFIKVLDFGIAKLEEDGRGDTETRRHGEEDQLAARPQLASNVPSNQLTIPGTIMGTASYMSPEQARGKKLDGRTDVFSLGVVLCETVTGKRLFPATTRVEAAAAAQQVDHLLPEHFKLAQVPKELQRIIRKSVQHDRDQRYASAGELLDDLTKLKRRRENRTTRRIIGVSSVAAAVALGLVILAAFLSINEVWEERILRDGHTAAVRRAVFSPDGRLLVSVSEDHQVLVWNFARREVIKRFTDHTGVVNAVSFSPDGKWFATASEDHTIIVWDAARLEKKIVLRDHPGPVRTLTFSSFGDRMVSSSVNGLGPGRTFVWDINSWTRVLEVPVHYHYGNHAFLENNRWLLDHAGRMWDLTSGAQVNGIESEALGSWIAISPDGKRLVSVDAHGDVKFVDVPQRYTFTTKHTHHDHGRFVAFSPDGNWVATAAERIVLWNAKTFERVVPLEYESIVWSVAFSPDSRWLVSTHGDGAVLVWDVAERELVANLREHSAGVRAVAFSPDGKRVATASADKSVIVWDIEQGRKEAQLYGHNTRVTAVAFSPDGRWLASADQVGNVIRWDIDKRVTTLVIHPPLDKSSYFVAISSDGRVLVTTWVIYDLEAGRPVISDKTGWNQVYSAAFSPDGKQLVGVTDQGELLIVDTEKWQVIERRKWSDTPLVTMSLSPDGRYMATGEDGKKVRLGTLAPVQQLAPIGQHTARVKSVVFSPDGKQVASAGDDKMIALWDVDRRKLITRIGTHTSPIYAIAFSPDGRRLISGEHDRSVRVYTRRRELWGFPLQWQSSGLY